MADLELSRGSSFIPRSTVLLVWLIANALFLPAAGLDPLGAAVVSACILGAALLVIDLLSTDLVVRRKPASSRSDGTAAFARKAWSGIRRRTARIPLQVEDVDSANG